MVLSTERIARMQAVSNQTMTDECLIERYIETSDGQGGTTTVWTTVGVVKCRIAPSGHSPAERDVANQLQASSLWTVTLPAGTVVLPPDRIEHNSETYQVVKALTRTVELERRVVTEKVG